MILNKKLFNFDYNSRHELNFSVDMFVESFQKNGWGISNICAVKKESIFYIFSGRQRLLSLQNMNKIDFKNKFPDNVTINIYSDMPIRLVLCFSYSLFFILFLYILDINKQNSYATEISFVDLLYYLKMQIKQISVKEYEFINSTDVSI